MRMSFNQFMLARSEIKTTIQVFLRQTLDQLKLSQIVVWLSLIYSIKLKSYFDYTLCFTQVLKAKIQIRLILGEIYI